MYLIVIVRIGRYELKKSPPSALPAENVATPLTGQSLYQKYNFESPSLDRNVRNGYEGNSLIAGAVSFWQFAFVQAMFASEDPKVLSLLQNPNPEQSESDFKLSIITNILVGGETFILGGRNSSSFGGEVVQLWNYHAGLIQPLYNESGFLSKYLYYNPNKPGDRREYDIRDVIHLKWMARGAYNANKGVSPIAQVFREINLDNEVGRSVYSYLKNDLLRAKVGLVDSSFEAPNPKARMEMKQAMLEQTTGDNKGMPFFMQGIKDLVNINGSFDELNTENLLAEAEARVANVFGVSPILLEWPVGLKRTSENNVREADKRFNTRKFSPLLQMFGETLTHGFKNRFGFQGEYRIGFDKSNMESFQDLQLERESSYIEQYTKGAITLDELRVKLGREKVSGSKVANSLRSTPAGAAQFMGLVKMYSGGAVTQTAAVTMAVNTFGYGQNEAEAMFPKIDKPVDMSNSFVTPPGEVIGAQQ